MVWIYHSVGTGKITHTDTKKIPKNHISPNNTDHGLNRNGPHTAQTPFEHCAHGQTEPLPHLATSADAASTDL